METTHLYRTMADLADQGTPFVLATVIESVGSTPRKAGSKMIVMADGRTVDTVGGGKVEAQVIADSVEALKRGVSEVKEYDLRPTGEHALGMVCGGHVKVFLEVHVPSNTLLIIGAGHIGQKLCPMAKALEFRVIVLDARAEYANADRFPLADGIVVGHPKDVAELVAIDDRTHIVIVTHGHMHDKDALRSVAGAGAGYVGMIGSRGKVKTVLSELMEEGVSAEVLAKVKAPIGLDLGGHTPGEVSLSILAQVVAERHGKGGSAGPAALSVAQATAEATVPSAGQPAPVDAAPQAKRTAAVSSEAGLDR
ncbi:MAG: XdhC/CoxI family protein [Actinobacteria bacterium]|nr:XdhC/CoxI family protein [Actinomycetota bacterium]